MILALPRDKHNCRSCETRLSLVVTAFADISTFIFNLLQILNIGDVLLTQAK
jgi:hypothetical protein